VGYAPLPARFYAARQPTFDFCLEKTNSPAAQRHGHRERRIENRGFLRFLLFATPASLAYHEKRLLERAA
jgi:hypothetical protein